MDGLKEKLEDFRVATDALAENAMTLSAANLDEALRLVEDAAQRSAQAQVRASFLTADVTCLMQFHLFDLHMFNQ